MLRWGWEDRNSGQIDVTVDVEMRWGLPKSNEVDVTVDVEVGLGR